MPFNLSSQVEICSFLLFSVTAHVFISASNWVWNQKCLQNQQGGKWDLKNQMPVWHGQLSVSAALPTTGSAEWQVQTQLSRPSIPVPATVHRLAAGKFPFLAPDAEETGLVADAEMGWFLCQLFLQQHFPRKWKYLQSNYTTQLSQ